MLARGYRQGDNPELLVNFVLGSKDKVEGDSGPAFGIGVGRWGRGGWGWGGSYGGVYSGRDIRTITEGSLTVDVVDQQKKGAGVVGHRQGPGHQQVRKQLAAGHRRCRRGDLRQVSETAPRRRHAEEVVCAARPATGRAAPHRAHDVDRHEHETRIERAVRTTDPWSLLPALCALSLFSAVALSGCGGPTLKPDVPEWRDARRQVATQSPGKPGSAGAARRHEPQVREARDASRRL